MKSVKEKQCVQGIDCELTQIQEIPKIKDDIHEVYLYYNQPIVYSIVDRIGRKYLVILINWMSKEDEYEWLYLPITDQQIEEYVELIDLVNIETVEAYQRKLMKSATSDMYLSIMSELDSRHYTLSIL